MAEELDLELDENEEPLLITLEDEEGQEHEFEVIDTMEYHDNYYYAMTPTEESDAEELDGELVILKAEEVDGESFFAVIDDDEEYAEVIDLFMQRLADQFDIEIPED